MFWGPLPSSEKADTLLSASTQHKPRAPGVDRGSAALSTDYGTDFGFLGMLLPISTHFPASPRRV